VPGVHGAEVEELHRRTSLNELRGIIGRRRKLLQDLSPDAGGGLLHLDQRAVAKVALHEKHHLVVLHEHLVAAHVVEPSLHEGLDARLVLVGPGSGRRDRWWNGRDKRLEVGRYQVVGELNEFGVQASDVAVLRGAESREVGL
jgi:hypothetical protein